MQDGASSVTVGLQVLLEAKAKVVACVWARPEQPAWALRGLHRPPAVTGQGVQIQIGRLGRDAQLPTRELMAEARLRTGYRKMIPGG